MEKICLIPIILPAIFGNGFADTSSRIYLHFAQLILNNRFSQFDYGPIENLVKYKQLVAPEYPLHNISSENIILVNDYIIIIKTMASKKLVIIDTDCGVDDALAIMLATYCQKQDMIDILGITCSFGNTYVDNVCKNVCYTLRASELEQIKVYRGCEGPIIGKYVSDDYYGKDGYLQFTRSESDPQDVYHFLFLTIRGQHYGQRIIDTTIRVYYH
ncbi:unnamed protein product [Oppiella nova]|uniref:Inosine/uridine-preferring nucleoside hydrolase domain-containing protein n=1 Tax=Oppiella nova TaxID=334625 RepID=A0A7R9LQU5_9ACAR|nr:unnamed protein product [Oppiella nova]CAG2165713.1 unnamed protein product [Oppiella nova]